MFQPTLEQDLDLWEAWIEFDHLSADAFGTLHIWGEIVAGRKEQLYVIKKEAVPGQLKLEVVSSSDTLRNRITEVHYSEPIRDIGCYETILIYRESQLLTQIGDIEVVI